MDDVDAPFETILDWESFSIRVAEVRPKRFSDCIGDVLFAVRLREELRPTTELRPALLYGPLYLRLSRGSLSTGGGVHLADDLSQISQTPI
jgi:hypothetical protein